MKNIQKINLTDYTTRRVGPQKKICHYQHALYSTLVNLKPKVCLEIGTNTGSTATIFQKYFDEYCRDGLLVTCDIKKYVDLSHLKNVRQILVAHHIDNISQFHQVDSTELKYDYKNSVEKNTELILNEAAAYDFAFIDGDHTKMSFLSDVQICKNVLKEPQFMLIDDTKEPVHECMKVYEEQIKNSNLYDCYDFEDWEEFVGCSLVRMRM